MTKSKTCIDDTQTIVKKLDNKTESIKESLDKLKTDTDANLLQLNP